MNAYDIPRRGEKSEALSHRRANLFGANQSLIPVHRLLAHSGNEIASTYQKIVADIMAFAMSRQGADGFISTRGLAAAHEAGHWVWLALHGHAREILSVRIWRTEQGEWVGSIITRPRQVAIGPDTPVDEIRAFIELTLAGYAGEWLSGRVKLGSSMDEQALAQLVCAGLAAQTGADPRMLFVEIMCDTLTQLKANQAAFDAIAADLERHYFLRGKAVTRLSALVQPHDPTAELRLKAQRVTTAELLDCVPGPVRQTMDDLLAGIGDNLANPKWNTSHGQSKLARKLDALRAAAIKLFARHFLPIVVPGEWLHNTSLRLRYLRDIARPMVDIDRVHMFRRKGSKGPFSVANTIIVIMLEAGETDELARHGRKALFEIDFEDRQLRCTLKSDSRLSCLSWHHPGKTGLVILADPGLLAVRRYRMRKREVHPTERIEERNSPRPTKSFAASIFWP